MFKISNGFFKIYSFVYFIFREIHINTKVTNTEGFFTIVEVSSVYFFVILQWSDGTSFSSDTGIQLDFSE